jgi:hypothetical protein
MPKIGVPCSPSEMKSQETVCKSGWKHSNNENPLAYRLKPLSLLGVIPNQGLYHLNVSVTKCSRITVDTKTGAIKLDDVSSEYKKVKLNYGLTDVTKENNLKTSISFNGIDVSVPFFILEVIKPAKIGKSSVYKTGIEIPWSFKNSGIDASGKDKINKLTVDVYKIVKTMLGSLNKVDLSDNCENSQLFNTHKQLRIELEYSWKFASEIPEMAAYNDAVKELRTVHNKPISYYLSNLNELCNFQTELAHKLAKIPSIVPVTELVDEDNVSLDYPKEMGTLIDTAEPVNSSETSEE